jgi:hypothetical protein
MIELVLRIGFKGAFELVLKLGFSWYVIAKI